MVALVPLCAVEEVFGFGPEEGSDVRPDVCGDAAQVVRIDGLRGPERRVDETRAVVVDWPDFAALSDNLLLYCPIQDVARF